MYSIVKNGRSFLIFRVRLLIGREKEVLYTRVDFICLTQLTHNSRVSRVICFKKEREGERAGCRFVYLLIFHSLFSSSQR